MTKLKKKYTRFRDIPPFIRWGNYEVDVSWSYLEHWIKRQAEDIGVDLDPDFQRAHVWTEAQQVAYVEHCLRGGSASRVILWNCHDWEYHTGKHPVVLVDGKQRIEAVRAFLRDDIKAFRTKYSRYQDKLGHTDYRFRFVVNSLKTKAEVLQWYLEINAGGVAHTDEEIEKVRRMLQRETR